MLSDLNFWHKARLYRVALALSLAILIAIFLGFYLDQDNSSLLKRGDFPGFYVLAVIHKMGLLDRLYDPTLQNQIENHYWPSFHGGFYMSVYPMYTAVLLSPLAYFSAEVAQYIFTALMFLSFVICLRFISKLNPAFQENKFANYILVFWFAPIFIGILGAQNTGLSMLLFVSICMFIQRRTTASDILAGIACGLWFYKPQYAIFVLILMLVSRLWLSIISAALVGICLYLLAAINNNFLWPLQWTKALQEFSGQNFMANAQQMTSIKGTAIAIQNYFELFGGIGSTISILSTSGVTGLFIFFLIQVSKVKRENLHLAFLIFGPLLVLISPQTLFYDLGIAIVGYFSLMKLNKDKNYWEIIGLIVISWILVLSREYLPIPIFFFLPLFMLIRILKEISSSNLATSD